MKTDYTWLIAFLLFFNGLLLHAQVDDAIIDTLKFDQVEVVDDSVTYELVIMDPAFETWFIRVRRPESYYNINYLESWNQKLTSQWNTLLRQPNRSVCMPSTYLDYDWKISYGLTLNYKLFYYFRFMQERCSIFNNHPANWRAR